MSIKVRGVTLVGAAGILGVVECAELLHMDALKPHSHAETHRPIETLKFQFEAVTSVSAPQSNMPIYTVVDVRKP